jgi:L-threonylcarbamoyladenylate synthase
MSVVVFKKSKAIIPELCKLLRAGKVIAAPTETAFGLLADATNIKAIAEIQRLKGREKNKPIPLVSANLLQAKKYLSFSPIAIKLARRFWPGPLTLVLSAKYFFPRGIVSKEKEVGLRVPTPIWLRRLVESYGKPLTATSANRAGKPTLYNHQAVAKELSVRGLRYIVQGNLRPRLTSTVVRIKNNKIEILRQGAVTNSKIKKYYYGV